MTNVIISIVCAKLFVFITVVYSKLHLMQLHLQLIVTDCNILHTGPTLLLTSDIIKQRLGAAALDRYVLWQPEYLWVCCIYVLHSTPTAQINFKKDSLEHTL